MKQTKKDDTVTSLIILLFFFIVCINLISVTQSFIWRRLLIGARENY